MSRSIAEEYCKAFGLGGGRKVELIGQVFNLLGRTNLGGVGSSYQISLIPGPRLKPDT